MPKFPLEKAKQYAKMIQKAIRFEDTNNFEVHIVGSIAREEDKIGDYDFLILTKKYIDDILESLYFTKNSNITIKKIRSCGQYACMLTLSMPDDNNLKVDIFYNTIPHKPFALLHHIGPKSYNIRIRRIAHEKYNLLLNQYGLFDRSTGRPITKKFRSVQDIQDYLHISRRLPHQRR
jgi:DNA polymerase/3'-5' exonuclease PolX